MQVLYNRVFPIPPSSPEGCYNTVVIYSTFPHVIIIQYVSAVFILNKLLSVLSIKNKKNKTFYVAFIYFFSNALLSSCRSEFLSCNFLFSEELLLYSLQVKSTVDIVYHFCLSDKVFICPSLL